MSDLLNGLHIVIDALTWPTQHHTPRWTWSADRRNRNKIRLPDHTVSVPGLLTQLAALAFPLTVDGDAQGGARGIPESREPGNPRALVAYVDIVVDARRWAAHLGIGRRTASTNLEQVAALRAEGDRLAAAGWPGMARLAYDDAGRRRHLPGPAAYTTVRALLGAAPSAPRHEQVQLLGDAGGWLGRCEEITGAVAADPMLTVPCPDLTCQARTLRVDLAEHTVRCLSCGSRWAKQEDDSTGSLSSLAAYVVRYRQRSQDAADAAWAEARRRRAASYGWRDTSTGNQQVAGDAG